MRKYFFKLCAVLLFAGIVNANESDSPDGTTSSTNEEVVQISSLLPEASQPPAPAPGEEKKKSWFEFIKWFGDFRYRWETISQEDKDYNRHRNRIRARFGMKASLHESFDTIFRLATGSEDPVSTNQSLGGGYATKAINLDWAYVDWHPGQAEGLHAMAGKMKFPYNKPGKTELIWDSDLSPGGVAGTFDKKVANGEVFLGANAYWVEERKETDNAMMYGLQGAGKVKFGEKQGYLSGGVSLYYHTNLEGYPLIFDLEDGFGNTAVGNEEGDLVYAHDYRLVEFFVEGGVARIKVPLAVYFDYVYNFAPDVEFNKGWLVGFAVGKTKKPGSWEFKYNYRDIEPDAVLGVSTDSDFAGGGTNAKGSEIQGNVQISKYVKAGLSYFYNRLDPKDENIKYQRFFLDLNIKF